MAIITISTPFNIDLEFKAATFGSRLLAWAIDLAIIFVYYYIMFRGLWAVFGRVSEGTGLAIALCFIILPVIAYQLVFEIFLNGQTPGKKLARIKIIDNRGQQPSWGQYVTRWMLSLGNMYLFALPFIIVFNPRYAFSFFIVYIPDVISMMVTPASQRVGDLAAGTVVIDARYRPDINNTIYQEIEVRDYLPVFPQVMQLTDRDINGIRNLLEMNKNSRNPDDYTRQVVMKIKKVLKIEHELDGFDFLSQLLYDYNYLSSK